MNTQDNPQGVLSSRSYDADTPTVIEDGKLRPVRIKGIDGTEIEKIHSGLGNRVLHIASAKEFLPKDTGSYEGRGEAEFYRNGLYKILGDTEAQVISNEKDFFNRDLGNISVGGSNWRHLMYEVGVSDNWTNYSYDDKGSVEDETYKWYAGSFQATNIDAYKLLESDVEPNTIISDKEFNRINDLRASVQTHLHDASEGVLNKADAQATIQELMSRPDLLAKAAQRRWYENSRNTIVGEMMLSSWNDPYSRAELEAQDRVKGQDVAVRADTSVTGLLKSGFAQWAGTTNRYAVGEHTGSRREGTFQSTYSDEAIDKYIQDKNVTPEMAVKMYEAAEKYGTQAAIETGEFMRVNKTVLDTDASLAGMVDRNPVEGIVKTVVHAASPYLTDPLVYVGGGIGAKAAQRASTVAFSKVSSPVTRKILTATVVGGGAGLGESMVYTSRNYREFSNEELLQTWGTDTAFGAMFGSILSGAKAGIDARGAAVKRRVVGEDIPEPILSRAAKDEVPGEALIKAEEDAAWQVRQEEELAFQQAADAEYLDFVEAAQRRSMEMQDEVAQQLRTGEVDTPTVEIDVEPPVLSKPIEEPKSVAQDGTTQVEATPEQVQAADNALQRVHANETLDHHMAEVQPRIKSALSSVNFAAKLHKLGTHMINAREMANKLIMSPSKELSYIGTNILETGMGFAGKLNRRHSAALIKDSIYTRSVGNLNKSYVDNITAWAMEGGSNRYKAFKAAWEGGQVNDVAKQFHREVFKYQEALQMGKTPTPNKYVEDYIKQLNKTNDELFQGRIDANIKGFDKDRRISNYIPHVWKKVKAEAIVNLHGKEAVLELLEKSIESAKRAGKISEGGSTRELAERQLAWINGLGDSMEHTGDVGQGIAARSKSRIQLDFTVEHNGLSMLDFIDTNIPTVMDSYVQRAGADIGISKATNGLIRSEGDFDEFLTPELDADKLLMNDVKDMLYGRPTRDGMSPEMRSMMDLVTLQQMGGIGVAQLAETGTMAQRTIVNLMSRPDIAKRMWAMAGEDINDKGVMAQVRSIAAVTDNFEYINRYSVNNIDQAQIDELSHARAASIDAVDKATLGAYKAQFGRLLGSLSGVNAVQKAQSRLLQASFSVDVARSMKFGFDAGTSTKARLADLGISGKTQRAVREFVEFDEIGFPINFNFEKWDKKALDEFVYAMNREEAQLMPRVMAGELPVFMNRPLAQAILQFRKTPLAFMSKGAQRNLQFADREAVLGTVLNAMTAGVTRYSKLALAGAAYAVISDEEFNGPDLEDDFTKAAPYNYMSNLGILGDAYSVGSSWSKAAQEKEGIEALWEGAKQVPILSGMDNAYHALDGDPAAIKKSMPLNTLPLVTEVTNAVIRNLEQGEEN